ncbi:MAG: hypothetical protein M3P27_08930 [Acidobacteriota bacterium]|nr:hypothetical protein [Acidobacteriota bacterium]
MNVKTKKVIQGVLLAAFLVAAVRLVMVYRERDEPVAGLTSRARPEVDTGLDADAYVVPKRLHAYDLKSARQQLVGQPAWMREGYRYTLYPVSGGRVDFGKEAGTLGPIEQITIKDVRLQAAPSAVGGEQLVAVFVRRDGKELALPIGTKRGSDFTIYADEALFLEDPHQLYKHWPEPVWQAVAQHQVKPGMNEMQASFAIGMGTPHQSDDPAERVVEYPNGGKPLTVTYRHGKATRIDAGSEAGLKPAMTSR